MQYGPSVDGTDPTAVYLGLVEGRPFGLSAICPVPPGALSIDYFVGEASDRGRGLGAALIAAAVARGFADHPDAQDVLVPVVTGNVASWRALVRAGATWYAEGDLTPDNRSTPRRT